MIDQANGQRMAELIDDARRRQFPKLSIRKAAERAGISEGWWRQLVAGKQTRGDASFPVVGSAETYLLMARAVGIEADIAVMLGRDAPSDIASHQSPMTVDAIKNDPNLLPEAKQHLLNQYELLLRITSPAVSTADSRTQAAQARMEHLRADVRGQQRPAKEQERGTGTQGDG